MATVHHWYSNLCLPTRVSLQSVLQVLLQVFRIPFTHVSAFSMKHRTQNATRILLHNTHPLGQLQIERQSGSVVVKVVVSCTCILYSCGILAFHFVWKWWRISIHLLRCTKNVCGGCRGCRSFHTEWTRCILIIFRLGFRASFFYCHVPLIARFNVIIFRLQFSAIFLKYHVPQINALPTIPFLLPRTTDRPFSHDHL